VVCCYEAGPLGYGLMRELEALGLRCHAAVLLPGVEKAAEDPFANTPEAIRRWVRRLVQRAPGPIAHPLRPLSGPR
jgi:hypothetical protein